MTTTNGLPVSTPAQPLGIEHFVVKLLTDPPLCLRYAVVGLAYWSAQCSLLALLLAKVVCAQGRHI